jgi:hypothetical protein
MYSEATALKIFWVSSKLELRERERERERGRGV